MNVILLMLGVTACYTVASLSDRYAAHDVGFSTDEFTFIMCSSLSVFLLCSLPFQEIRFTPAWQSFAAILLIAVCKYLEFSMCALVLRQMSAFELKAWLGINLFVSYFTDVIGGEPLSFVKLGCIAITATGLVLIVHSGSTEKPNYRKIILPLALYLLSKYGYSIVIKGFSPYISPTVQLIPALILVALVTLIRVRPAALLRKDKKGTFTVVLARIPNAIGMLLENAVIAISITSYSFIQPMILVTLFLIGLIRNRDRSSSEILGSVVCITGIVLFAVT